MTLFLGIPIPGLLGFGLGAQAGAGLAAPDTVQHLWYSHPLPPPTHHTHSVNGVEPLTTTGYKLGKQPALSPYGCLPAWVPFLHTLKSKQMGGFWRAGKSAIAAARGPLWTNKALLGVSRAPSGPFSTNPCIIYTPKECCAARKRHAGQWATEPGWCC